LAYVSDDEIAVGEVRSIDVGLDGSIWFACSLGGVSRLNPGGWQTYTESEGLADDRVWAGTVSPDGSVWFGTYLSGLVNRYDGSGWTSYGESQGLGPLNTVWSLASAQDGTIWAGTDDGVARFNGLSWEMFSPITGSVRSVTITDDGAVWIGTYRYKDVGQVARYDGSTWVVYGDGDSLNGGDWIRALAQSQDGTVWAGTTNGLFQFGDDRWTAMPYGPKSINDIAVAPDGTLWVATEFSGVWHYDGAWRENYWLGDGLLSLRNYAVAIDPSGALWVGGRAGATRLTPRQ
jgi:ligand-binding sensor domain-containing protein